MSTATVTRYRCARCDTALPAERMIYSSHTKNRYCLDFDGCDRRAKRAAKKEATS